MIGTCSIVDVSHNNCAMNFSEAKQDGIAAVIHKATQGVDFVDPMYATNSQAILANGLLLGAHHFGDSSDGKAQADFFLETCQPTGNEIMVLDLEENPSGNSMTLDQAVAFVQEVFQSTGRWPGLYSSAWYLNSLPNACQGSALTNCWLWVAEWGPEAPGELPVAWGNWTLWQYTDGTTGSGAVPVNGIGACDRDSFNGTPSELQTFWNAGGVLASVAP